MVLLPLPFESVDLFEAVDAMIAHSRPDGVILTPPLTDMPSLLERLNEMKLPYGSVSPKKIDDEVGVTLDERQAVRDMMDHLVSLGHRRIAHIKGHPAHGASGWRLDGYREVSSAPDCATTEPSSRREFSLTPVLTRPETFRVCLNNPQPYSAATTTWLRRDACRIREWL